jgi:hypothetical protein
MEFPYSGLGDDEIISKTLCRSLATLNVRQGRESGEQERLEIREVLLTNCHADMGIDFDIGLSPYQKGKSYPELCSANY